VCLEREPERRPTLLRFDRLPAPEGAGAPTTPTPERPAGRAAGGPAFAPDSASPALRAGSQPARAADRTQAADTAGSLRVTLPTHHASNCTSARIRLEHKRKWAEVLEYRDTAGEDEGWWWGYAAAEDRLVSTIRCGPSEGWERPNFRLRIVLEACPWYVGSGKSRQTHDAAA
jgi:hypothetical protein